MVKYDIGVTTAIDPSHQLPPIPPILRGELVVIGGRAPVWLYGYAFHALHGSAAGAIAVYDPRIGAVVVASHSVHYTEGQVIDDITW